MIHMAFKTIQLWDSILVHDPAIFRVKKLWPMWSKQGRVDFIPKVSKVHRYYLLTDALRKMWELYRKIINHRFSLSKSSFYCYSAAQLHGPSARRAVKSWKTLEDPLLFHLFTKPFHMKSFWRGKSHEFMSTHEILTQVKIFIQQQTPAMKVKSVLFVSASATFSCFHWFF